MAYRADLRPGIAASDPDIIINAKGEASLKPEAALPKSIDEIRKSDPFVYGDSLDETILKLYREENHPDMSQEAFNKALGYEDPNAQGSLSRGAEVAWDQIKQVPSGLLAGAGAGGETMFGEGGLSTTIKKFGLEGFEKQAEEIRKISKPTDSLTYSYDELKNGNPNAMVEWVKYAIGYGGVQIAGALVTRGIGNVGGKFVTEVAAKDVAAKLTKSELAKLTAANLAKPVALREAENVLSSQAAKAAGANISKWTERMAMAAYTTGMEVSEIGGSNAQKTVGRGSPLTPGELSDAALGTVGAVGLEYLQNMMGTDLILGKGKISTLTGAGGLALRTATKTGVGLLGGGVTEFGQTAAERFGEGKPLTGTEAVTEYVDSAGLGAFSEGAAGTVGGLLSKPQPKVTPPPAITGAGSVDEAIAGAQEELAKPIALPHPSAQVGFDRAHKDGIPNTTIAFKDGSAINAREFFNDQLSQHGDVNKARDATFTAINGPSKAPLTGIPELRFAADGTVIYPKDLINEFVKAGLTEAQGREYVDRIGTAPQETIGAPKPDLTPYDFIQEQQQKQQQQAIELAAKTEANKNPIDRLLDQQANAFGVPGNTLHGVATVESGKRQYGKDGKVIRPTDKDGNVLSNAIGVMQIIPRWHRDLAPELTLEQLAEKLASDVDFNIASGAKILRQNFDASRNKKAHKDFTEAEHWDAAVKAYYGSTPGANDIYLNKVKATAAKFTPAKGGFEGLPSSRPDGTLAHAPSAQMAIQFVDVPIKDLPLVDMTAKGGTVEEQKARLQVKADVINIVREVTGKPISNNKLDSITNILKNLEEGDNEEINDALAEHIKRNPLKVDMSSGKPAITENAGLAYILQHMDSDVDVPTIVTGQHKFTATEMGDGIPFTTEPFHSGSLSAAHNAASAAPASKTTAPNIILPTVTEAATPTTEAATPTTEAATPTTEAVTPTTEAATPEKTVLKNPPKNAVAPVTTENGDTIAGKIETIDGATQKTSLKDSNLIQNQAGKAWASNNEAGAIQHIEKTTGLSKETHKAVQLDNDKWGVLDTRNVADVVTPINGKTGESPKAKVKPGAKQGPNIHEHDSLLTAIAKLGGLSANEAKAQGIDPAAFKTLGHGIKRVFHNSHNADSYDGMAETLRQYGYDVPDANDLVDKVSRSINQGEHIYTPKGDEHHAELKRTEDLKDHEARSVARMEQLLEQAAALDKEHGTDFEKRITDALTNDDSDEEITAWEDDLEAERQDRQKETVSDSTETSQPEEELLTTYTEGELTEREKDAERLARQKKDADLKAKLKEESDKSVATLEDEMLGIGRTATNDIFSEPRPDIPTTRSQEETKTLFKEIIDQAILNDDIGIPEITIATQIIRGNKFDLMGAFINKILPNSDVQFQKIKAKGGVDVKAILALIGATMYAANLAETSIKELVQNSFDAVKAQIASDSSLKGKGKVEVIVDHYNRLITVIDNGKGMSPKVITNAFLTIAGTDKGGLAEALTSGGFGMAKAAFLYGNEKVYLRTVHDGKLSTLITTPDALLGPPRGQDNINVTDTDEPNGTMVIVKVPLSTKINGEERAIWFPHSAGNVEFFDNPLITDDVEFTFNNTHTKGYLNLEDNIKDIKSPTDLTDNDDDKQVVPIGKHQDLSGYTKNTTANFSWGSADIYISIDKETSKWSTSHKILSAGIFQFNDCFNKNDSEAVPYKIIVDLHPKVKASAPNYPINLKREGWKDNIKEDIKALKKYVARVVNGYAAQDTANMFKNVTMLPIVDIEDDTGTDHVTYDDFRKKQNKPLDVKKASYSPAEIDVDDGKVTGKGEDGKTRTFVDLKDETDNKKAEKRQDSTFDAGKEAPKLSDFLLDIGLDVNAPIFLDNTNINSLKDDNGDVDLEAVKMFAEFGSVMIQTRNTIRDIVKNNYGFIGINRLSDENTFVGVSIDKEYYGVHINVPFHGVFLNPLATRSGSVLEAAASMWDTIVHEFTHVQEGNHDVNFVTTFHSLNARLSRSGYDIKTREILRLIIKKYEPTYSRLVSEYDKSTTKNIANPIHKGEGVSGTTSEIRESSHTTNDKKSPVTADKLLRERPGDDGGSRLSNDAGFSKLSEGREAPAKDVGYLKSTQETAKGTGSTVEQVKAWLPARAAKAVTVGRLKIAKNLSELRQLLGKDNPAIRDEDFGDTEGFYDPKTDTIYLIANALTKATLRSAFAHESGHRALATDPQLKAALAKFDGDLQSRFDLAGKGLGTPIEKAAYRRVMQSETLPENRLEEFKAYLISEYAKDPTSFTGKLLKLIKDMVAAVRVALLKQGLDFGMVRQLSPADLLAMSRYGTNIKSFSGQAQESGVLASTEGIGETVEVDGRVRPTRDSNGAFIHPTIRGQKNFWRWFHGSETVDDQGRPIALYHGTTSDFSVFDKSKAFTGSDLGGGFYFTNTQSDVGDNYAGKGPDMRFKINRLAERYQQDLEDSGESHDMAYDMAQQQAQRELMSNGGTTMKVYVKMENPVVLSHSRSRVTNLTYEESYDDDMEDYGDPSGTLVNFLDALHTVETEYDIAHYTGGQVLLEDAMDWGYLDALDIIAKLQDAYINVEDDNGDSISTEIIRRAFEEAGYDGFIDETVDVKFGSQNRLGNAMTGMNPDSVHYVAFSPENVKSAIGNNGDFDPSNTDIRRSQVLRSTKDTDIGNLADLDTLLSSGRLPQEVTGWRARMDKIADWLVDSTREFDVWARQFSDQELAGKMILAKDRSTRKSAIMEKTALDKFMKPFAEKIESIAGTYQVQGNDMNFRAAKTLVGRWMTARYALQKNRDYLAQDAKAISDAEADLITKMRNDTTYSVNKSEAALTKLKAKAKPGQTFKVQEAALKKLKRIEQHAINGDIKKVPGYSKEKGAITRLITQQALRDNGMHEQRLVDPTLTPLDVGLAGGFNNFTAQHYLNEIEKVIPKSVLQDAAKDIYDMNTWKLHQDLINGKVTQQQVTEWNLSPIYVPLTGDPSVDTSEDSLFSHGSLNQTTDHRAVGRSGSLSQDGVDASVEQVQKSARYHGWADFKADFEQLYEGLVTEKTAPGMTRKEAEDAVMRDYHISKHAESGAIPQSPSDIIIRRGGESTVYNIHNEAAVIALKRMNEEQIPSMLAMPAKYVQIAARLVTVFMPGFGLSNAIRDTWEKSENIRFRTLPGYANLDMNKIGNRAFKLGMFTPTMVKKIMGVMLEGTKFKGRVAVDNTDPDVILLRELIAEGGTSTVGDFLSSSSETLSKQMEESIHWGRETLQAVTAWNNAFELMSSFSVYKALREQNVDAKTAAGSVLNLMNFNKAGSKTGLLRALYMFVNPTFQGGHQLIQTLSTPGGQRRAMAYIVAGSALYMMLREMAGDDDKLKRNKLDAQSNSMLERNIMIPLPWDTDTFVKIPMGFGLAQLTWGISTNLVKVLFGDKSALDASGDIFKSATRTLAPVAPSEASISEHFTVWLMQTFTPQIAKPLANVAMGRDAFGRELTNEKFGKSDKPLSWQGRKTTPMIYKQISAQLGQMGFEVYPENVREVANGYLPGILHEVIKATIDNPNKEALGRDFAPSYVDRFIAKHDTHAYGDRLYYATREKMDDAATRQALGKPISKEEQSLLNLLPAVKEIEGKANGILSKGKRHAQMTDIGPVTNSFTVKRAEAVRARAKELVLRHLANH